MSVSHLKRAAVVFTCATLLACSGVPVHMGLAKGERLPAGVGRDIASEACGFYFILYVPIGIQINGRLARAYAALEAQANGDPITDVQVQEAWHYAFVGTVYCTKLRARAIHPLAEAAPVELPSAPEAAAAEPAAPGPASVPAVPQPAFAPGMAVRLREGASLRNRPVDGGAVVDPGFAPTGLTLKSPIMGNGQTWWYVLFKGGAGWARQEDLLPQP